MGSLLKDKVILVTGAGRGVGRDIALQAAAAGAKVVVNDLGVSLEGASEGDTPAAEVVREIEEAGGSAIANLGSVADPDQAERMIAEAESAFGRIDGIVNNAGILRDSIFHKMSESDWDAVIAVHLKGCYNVSRAAAERFRAQQSGRMVHMTSTAALIGNIGQANYAAAKLGIVGLSNTVANEMKRYNVTSNAIAPFAHSRMTGSIPVKTEDDKRRMERIRKMASEKVAPLVVALLSDQAGHVNGQIFSARANELYLFSQPRPVRTLHRENGWTAEAILSDALPAFSGSFFPPSRTGDVFTWDPV